MVKHCALTNVNFDRGIRILAGAWGSTSRLPKIQLIVPRSAKCFYSKMVKHCALTNVNSDRGFESWPNAGYEVSSLLPNFPTWGARTLDSSPRPHIWETSRCCVSHGHRIDFCESAVLSHFAIKAFCTSRNSMCVCVCVCVYMHIYYRTPTLAQI
jgi:hypothetical protein